METFKIQTLSDRNYINNHSYTRLADPVTVIMGIGTILPSLFPNLIGSELNSYAVLDKLFPGSGFWTTKYKNYLLTKIKYVKDIQRDLHQYTGEFIEQNLNSICPGCQGTAAWQAFYKLLQQEGLTGGQSPVGNVFGAGFDPSMLLLIGGGVLLLFALTKKKKKNKK